MYRELYEEIGLRSAQVQMLGQTPYWLRYRLPHSIRRHSPDECIGQKQIWFILRLLGNDADICLKQSRFPEFDSWRWVDFWYPIQHVVLFKRAVYVKALSLLLPFAQQALGPSIVMGQPNLAGSGQSRGKKHLCSPRRCKRTG